LIKSKKTKLMKNLNLVLAEHRFDVKELSHEETKSINGGAAPLIAILAVAGGICLGACIGALVVYAVWRAFQ